MENEKIFKTLKLISERLSIKNTTKNIRLYFAYLFRCMRLDDKKYKSYDYSQGKYPWQDLLAKNWAMPEGDNYGKKCRKKDKKLPQYVAKELWV